MELITSQRQVVMQSARWRTRRAHKRLQLQYPNWATLTLEAVDGSMKSAVCTKCSVLDASGESLAIRGLRPIPRGTAVSVEVYVRGRHCWLSGGIAQCVRTSDAVRIGIKLDFLRAGKPPEPMCG